jgi:hypothetical protein
MKRILRCAGARSNAWKLTRPTLFLTVQVLVNLEFAATSHGDKAVEARGDFGTLERER